MPHSPGPWTTQEIDSQGQLVYIAIKSSKRSSSTIVVKAGKDSIAVAGVYGNKTDGSLAGRKYRDAFGITRHSKVIADSECRANAQLIAASPILLAACESMLRVFRHIPIPEEGTTEHKDLLSAREELISAIRLATEEN